MTARPLRLTIVTADVMGVILAAVIIGQRAGHSPGAVGPALERLEAVGWIESRWEDPKPRTRPRRRYCIPTDVGRQAYARERAGRT